MKDLKTLAAALAACLLLSLPALALEEADILPPEEEAVSSAAGNPAEAPGPPEEPAAPGEENPDPEPAPLAGEAGITALVRTSDEFRAALASESVGRVVYQGRLTVEYEPDEDNNLDAGTKLIEPANPDSDEDNLIFESGVTLLHISRHQGNTEDPDSQSVRMIYGREYNDGYADYGLVAEAAGGWLGWYEYHGPDSAGDPDAGYRLCYMLYCGSWEDAVTAAEDLTAGGWKHTPTASAGDENQIIFLQFGWNRSEENNTVTVDRDVNVTCFLELLGGQNLEIASGAHVTAGGLSLELMGSDYAFQDRGMSGLHVENGGSVTIHRWEGEDSREDGPYLDNGGRPWLGAQGELRFDNLETGLVYDENADIWSEYRPFLLTPEPLAEDGPAGSWDALSGTDSLTLEDGYAGGFLYAAWFGRREEEDGSLSPAGWWFDQEGADTAVVTDENGRPSGGLIVDWTEADGQAGLTAVSPGWYLIYRYHDPDRWEEWGWEDGWIPNENGTDAFGTDILGAEGAPIRVRVESVPKRSAGLEEREDGTVLAWPELPRRALERTAQAFAVSGEGRPLAGEVLAEEGAVSFTRRPQPGWGLILVDGDFRPVCGKLEITE